MAKNLPKENEWDEIIIPEPKPPFKPNIDFKQTYNDYGFNDNNGMYSLVEENRDFRKYIENEIIEEAIKTQNVLGNHITNEANRVNQFTENETNRSILETKSHINKYVVGTLNGVEPTMNDATLDEIKTDTSYIKDKSDAIKTDTDNIWDRVRGW